jgi:hypothetical protein
MRNIAVAFVLGFTLTFTVITVVQHGATPAFARGL